MRKLYLVCCLLGFAISSSAEDLTLTVPEMEPKMTYGETMSYRPELSLDVTKMDLSTASNEWKADFDFFKSKTNPGVKPYKFMDELTFVGIPLFVAGIAIKGDKAMFAQNNKEGKKNTQLLTDFKTGIDDYSQYFGPALTVGLKLGGYEGRSDWPRLLASAGMSYGIMAALVNGIKYTAKEMRPDGSQANSWPSGHTATAFVGATLLHKEYGLTRSPWFSVAGYGVATATGVMRILNNRHWISDIMSGAGIGIMSTELGYALCDLMFKGKGLLRNDLDFKSENPSFFSISMGLGLGNKSIDFEEEGEKESIKFRSATVVDAEGAYFFNKYVGVGGRLRVRAMSAKSFGQYAENVLMEDYNAWDGMMSIYKQVHPEDYPTVSTDPDMQYINDWFTYYDKIGYNFESEEAFYGNAPVTDIYGTVKSDHITEFTGSVGLYFNLPLSKHFSLGTKALIGRSFTQELDIDGHAEGHVKDIDFKVTMVNKNQEPNYTLDRLEYPNNTGSTWTDDWDYLTLGAQSSTSFGTGISLTYRYKSNFSWRIFCDYDYTKKTYTLKYDPFHFLQKGLTASAMTVVENLSEYEEYMNPVEYKKKKKMNYFTLGLSFLVNL
jgi:membrane-associated phospholipid phosphatase